METANKLVLHLLRYLPPVELSHQADDLFTYFHWWLIFITAGVAATPSDGNSVTADIDGKSNGGDIWNAILN